MYNCVLYNGGKLQNPLRTTLPVFADVEDEDVHSLDTAAERLGGSGWEGGNWQQSRC